MAWGGYFASFMSGFGVTFPGWLTHGYRAVTLSADPAVQALLETAPRIGGIPILLNIPAFAIVMLVTWVLLLGVRESARANNIMVVVKLLVLGLFVVVGAIHIDTANYVPFAPNGWAGIHQGAAIVFFAYIGFDAISTAAEETKNPQRNLPIGILGGLAICTLIYVIVGIVATGLVPYMELRAADPLAKALDVAGLKTAGWIVSFGAVISITAVLLVFQYGQPRIFFAMARDGLLPAWAAKVSEKRRVPHITTWATGIVVALGALVADENEIYDLTNIGTLSAFAIVCIGVLVLRYTEPDRPRPFRVPLVWAVSLIGASRVLLHDAGIAANGLGTVRDLARHRRSDLRVLRLQALPSCAGPAHRVRMVVSDHSEIPNWVLWHTIGLRCAALASTTSRISTSICRVTSSSLSRAFPAQASRRSPSTRFTPKGSGATSNRCRRTPGSSSSRWRSPTSI